MLDPERILVRPRITEKSHALAEKGSTYVFEVDRASTKDQIRQAVEKMYGSKGIHVLKVRTLVQRGKARRLRAIQGRTSTFKKAYVTLKAGETIDVL